MAPLTINLGPLGGSSKQFLHYIWSNEIATSDDRFPPNGGFFKGNPRLFQKKIHVGDSYYFIWLHWNWFLEAPYWIVAPTQLGYRWVCGEWPAPFYGPPCLPNPHPIGPIICRGQISQWASLHYLPRWCTGNGFSCTTSILTETCEECHGGSFRWMEDGRCLEGSFPRAEEIPSLSVS